MMKTDPSTTIVREITINAPAAKVFAALTEPEQLVQWWGDESTYRLEKMECDLRVGGTWRTTGRMVDGNAFAVEGAYRTIEPPRVLEYSWRYDWGPADQPETIVRFDLEEHDGATRVRVTHSGFVDPESKANHDRGWVTVLGWLHDYLE